MCDECPPDLDDFADDEDPLDRCPGCGAVFEEDHSDDCPYAGDDDDFDEDDEDLDDWEDDIDESW